MPGLTGVVAIAAGGVTEYFRVGPVANGFMLALKNDGSVWAWGDNAGGQLGDGTTTTRRTPVAVRGLSDVTAIAAGGRHALARTRNGRLWAWGDNARGQLGDGTTVSRATPARVPGLGGVTTLAAGARHSLALGAGGLGSAPVAVNDTYTTPANSPLVVPALGVLGNDTGGGTLMAVCISTAAHGFVQLNADGSFVYMPMQGFSGQDSFTYKVRAGVLESGAAVVCVTVAAADHRTPTIVSAAWADPNPVALPAETTAHVVASDPEGNALSYAWSQVSGSGTATFAAPGAAATPAWPSALAAPTACG